MLCVLPGLLLLVLPAAADGPPKRKAPQGGAPAVAVKRARVSGPDVGGTSGDAEAEAVAGGEVPPPVALAAGAEAADAARRVTRARAAASKPVDARKQIRRLEQMMAFSEKQRGELQQQLIMASGQQPPLPPLHHEQQLAKAQALTAAEQAAKAAKSEVERLQAELSGCGHSSNSNQDYCRHPSCGLRQGNNSCWTGWRSTKQHSSCCWSSSRS